MCDFYTLLKDNNACMGPQCWWWLRHSKAAQNSPFGTLRYLSDRGNNQLMKAVGHTLKPGTKVRGQTAWTACRAHVLLGCPLKKVHF